MFFIADAAFAEKIATAAKAIAPRNMFRRESAGISASPLHRMLAVSLLAALAASNRYEQIHSVANQALRLALPHNCPLEQFRAHGAAR